MSGSPLHLAATSSTRAQLKADLNGSAHRIDIPFVAPLGLSFVRQAWRADVDAAVVRAEDPQARMTASALRVAGIPVWWIGPAPRAQFPLGAPLIVSARADEGILDQVATAAARPGAGTNGTAPPLSIVITTLNEGGDLDRVVAALRVQLGPLDELIVVDGGSDDGSVERVRAECSAESRVRIEVHAGAGISTGRNIGIRLATNEVLICTDAGCDPAPGWVEGMRRAFTGEDAPGLVSGTYHVAAESRLQRAQALACYPDPYEVRRHDLATALYTAVFGLGFDPRFCVGRCVGFTRTAWTQAGGFPEHLATGEDVSFGLAVARSHRAVGTVDADVTWHQRSSIAATWRMYRNYGIASSDGGNLRLLVRDSMRGAAYLGVVPLLFSPRGRRMALAGGLLYLSLPIRRAIRARADVGVYPMLPVAMATKDIGKLWGAVLGVRRSGKRQKLTEPTSDR